ncbi:MAG: hypothetical protein EAY70_02835 [Sphingomonadales bacterium]|nr:MAG: hypothetical protein EAY70_02835 [Sphingomonadales bacterium]
MSGVLLHTLAWTGVLIAAVLVLRRPVSRQFGPEAAYALWALPLLRLLLPPLTLPAWMAPKALPPLGDAAPDAIVPAAAPPAEAVVWQAADKVPLAVPAEPASTSAGFDLFALLADLPLTEALLLVWLGGAGVFLWLRFAAYFRLRDTLLAEGREVGRVPRGFGGLRPAARLPRAA